MAEVTGVLSDIQRFSMHDGPGVRTTVFLKGCPLRCRWCHNPEAQAFQPQPRMVDTRCIGCRACAAVCPHECHCVEERHLFTSARCSACLQCVAACGVGGMEVCGHSMTVGSVLDIVARDRAFYQPGGVTISGGEPMAQPVFTLALLHAAKGQGIHTCVQTCGHFDSHWIEPLCDAADVLLWDVKDTNPLRYKQYTNGELSIMLDNLRQAAAFAAHKLVLRALILKGINDTHEHYQALRHLADEIGVTTIEPLAFHPYSGAKYRAIGRHEACMGEEYVPNCLPLL